MIIFGKGMYAEVVRDYFGYGDLVDDESFSKIVWGPDRRFYVAIGYSDMSRNRRKVYERLRDMGLGPVNYINALSCVSGEIGEHNFVMEFNTIQTKTEVGDNNVFWCHNHIGHHGKIGSHNFFASGITVSGSCEIGDHNFFGSGVTVGNEVKIGSGCVIGAGVLVMKDVPDNTLIVRKAESFSKTPAEKVKL